MAELQLEPVDLERDEINDINLKLKRTFRHHYALTASISGADINCENEEEILDALSRRLEKYFDDTNIIQGEKFEQATIFIRQELPETIICSHLHFGKAVKERKEFVKNLRNAADDVFGVTCQ
jgi:hypothetical protein